MADAERGRKLYWTVGNRLLAVNLDVGSLVIGEQGKADSTLIAASPISARALGQKLLEIADEWETRRRG